MILLSFIFYCGFSLMFIFISVTENYLIVLANNNNTEVD